MKAKVSFHGHSQYSDGLDSIAKLVQTARKLEMDYFGVSDHNTTEHIDSLYQEIQKQNIENEFPIIPICTTEIALFNGKYKNDLIFAKPGKLDSDFVKWLDYVINQRKNTKNLVPLIESAVKLFNALVVVPHPEMPVAPSIKFDLLQELEQQLTPKVKKNVGVEIRNWSANCFPKNKTREERLTKHLEGLDFAQVGMADFHSSSDIDGMYSLAEVAAKTDIALIQAFQKREIEPKRLTHATPTERIIVAKTLGQAMLRIKFMSKDKKDQMS